MKRGLKNRKYRARKMWNIEEAYHRDMQEYQRALWEEHHQKEIMLAYGFPY